MDDDVTDPEEKQRGHKTLRGYGPGDPGAEVEVGAGDSEEKVAPEVPRRPSAAPPTQGRGGTPLVEIEVIHEHGPAPNTEKPWRTLEVWTRNRIYTLDPTLSCVEVRDRGSREIVHDHPFLGMRLVGGQHREGDSIELSYPFPRPGTEAVFERPDSTRGHFSRTSAVTRVVLRLHIVTVAPSSVVPTWEEITGGLQAYSDDRTKEET